MDVYRVGGYGACDADFNRDLILFIPFPALATLISWLRGLFINQGATRIVNLGMAVNLFVTTAILIIGMQNEWPGIAAAAVAITIAAGVEFLILWWQIKGVLDFRFSLFDLKQRAFQG